MSQGSDVLRALPSKITHVRQRDSWDCGVTCLQMISKAAGLDVSREDIATALKTESTWTIDLAWYLRKAGFPTVFRTKTIGVDHNLKNQSFYADDWKADAARVTDLFKRSSEIGLDVKRVRLTSSQIASALRAGAVVLVLLDAQYILCPHCSIGAFGPTAEASRIQSFASSSASASPPASSIPSPSPSPSSSTSSTSTDSSTSLTRVKISKRDVDDIPSVLTFIPDDPLTGKPALDRSLLVCKTGGSTTNTMLLSASGPRADLGSLGSAFDLPDGGLAPTGGSVGGHGGARLTATIAGFRVRTSASENKSIDPDASKSKRKSNTKSGEASDDGDDDDDDDDDDDEVEADADGYSSDIEDGLSEEDASEYSDDSYAGHYVLLTGVGRVRRYLSSPAPTRGGGGGDDQGEKERNAAAKVGEESAEDEEEVYFSYMNPSITRAPCFISASRLDRARTAMGTDEDIVFVNELPATIKL